MSNRFYIVDVFAESKYAGNQLAVVRDAAALSPAEMQKIARETNYSETTFIASDTPEDGGYNVRIFTPERELPFAGHPTLGTAFIIQQEIIRKPVDSLILNLKVGRIPVTFGTSDSGLSELWMKQVPPAFGQPLDPGPALAAVGLRETDWDSRFPVQEVSTGLPFIIVPLKSLKAVKASRVDRDRLASLIEKTEAKDMLLFCPETYNPRNQLNVRVYCEYEGIPEDPATGSANGCLAGYLVQHRYFGEDRIDISVEQGYEIGRPSRLMLKASRAADHIDVFVGGNVIMVVKGEII